jgi:hypothetical protein
MPVCPAPEVHYSVITAIWLMALFTMPSLSYTAWRRIIELLVNDMKAARNSFGQGLFRGIESCTFARVIIRTRQGQKFVANCWLSRHIRFRLKFSHMWPNLGFIITSLKRSEIQCTGYRLDFTTKKNSTCFFCGKALCHNFLGLTRIISNELLYLPAGRLKADSHIPRRFPAVPMPC